MSVDFRAPLREEGAARFPWHTVAEEVTPESVEQGAAHLAFRRTCGLSVEDVARVHSVSAQEVRALELGERRFVDRRGLWAALYQLWLMRRGEP